VVAALGETGWPRLPHCPLFRQRLGTRCHLRGHRMAHRHARRFVLVKGHRHCCIGGPLHVPGMDHKLHDTNVATILQPK